MLPPRSVTTPHAQRDVTDAGPAARDQDITRRDVQFALLSGDRGASGRPTHTGRMSVETGCCSQISSGTCAGSKWRRACFEPLIIMPFDFYGLADDVLGFLQGSAISRALYRGSW
jgi:hypothetical protein